MDNLEKLYEYAESLSGMKEVNSEYEQKFTSILKAVSSSVAKEKMLASQFIARFAKRFPSLDSINAMFDLCEDPDVSVRKQVINDLPVFCRDFKSQIADVSYVLLQLLKTDDKNEAASIHKAMQNLLKIDSHATTTGMITLIREGTQATRLKIFRFLASKLKQMESGTLAPEAEMNLLTECKKMLKEFSSEEFTLLLEVLKYTRIGKSVSGQQTLADLAIDFSEAVASKDSEVTALEDAIASLKFALPFFCSAVRSSRMLKFVIYHLLPRFQDISDAHKVDLLKTLAVLTAHSGEIDEPQLVLGSLYPVFLEFVPPFNTEVVEQNVSFDYSSCEAVLFLLYKVGGKYPSFFSDQGRLSEFRLRLQHLSRNAVAYIKTLNDDIKKVKPDDAHLEEKRHALKVLSNIQGIVIDFMKNPPSFSKSILLSFETKKETQNEIVKRKRETVETEATSAKREKDNKGKGFYKQPYSVPGGKFSSRSDRQGFRGRFSGRGRY